MKVSEKNKRVIENWIEKFGHRESANKIIDFFIGKLIGLTSSDLPDTATFANGLDEIENYLRDGDYESALTHGKEVADEMLEDEGFPGFMEETVKDVYNEMVTAKDLDLDPNKPSNIVYDRIIAQIQRELKKLSPDEAHNLLLRLEWWVKNIT